ncbi:hypothetical protein Tco_0946264 [Tanacetum coccineum]
MLAPSGRGLILYQAYGNLYSMTGRKAHLLEDKQIPSVGVFDEVFSTWMAFGGNILARDGVARIKRRRLDQSSDDVRILVTASGRGRLKKDLESSTWQRRQEYKATPSRQQLFKYKSILRDRIKELELRTKRRNNFEEELFNDMFPTEEELAYHKELLGEPCPLSQP